MFQSSPAINCGRHKRVGCGCTILSLFQSSPAINCGRHAGSWGSLLRWTLFQSSPAINCGRHHLGPIPAPCECVFQSSPAINCGRHQIDRSIQRGYPCFNPHPRSTAGVTASKAANDLRSVVSILTRDQLRASPAPTAYRCQAWMFQSSPAINCGRHSAGAGKCNPCVLFQSSPAINCGRHQGGGICGGRPACFNPHPRSTAGVTRCFWEFGF